MRIRSDSRILFLEIEAGARNTTPLCSTIAGGGMMSNNDPFADRKRSQEEEYFRKQEQQNIEKMRRRAAMEAERKEMAQDLGVNDEAALIELQELGFTRETAPLVYLAPLAQVAWADGLVGANERKSILEAARARGVAEGGPADKMLADWLDARPAETFFEKAMRVVGAILRALPADQREAQKRDLISASVRIAEAAGGVLGFGNKVNKEEQEVIARITAELERSRETTTKETSGE
jgi:Mitochondrial ATPase inhibitor, IATP/Tellurite resistance protein TerB